MELLSDRPSNVDAGPLAGEWLYTDFPGAPAVRVRVGCVEGRFLVHFPPKDGDEGAVVPLTDMAAYGPHWRDHFKRIG